MLQMDDHLCLLQDLLGLLPERVVNLKLGDPTETERGCTSGEVYVPHMPGESYCR